MGNTILGPMEASLPGALRGGIRTYVLRPSIALAVAVPLVFLHRTYQPSVSVGLGTTRVDVFLSDWAILGTVAVAAAVGVRSGFSAFRAAPVVWLTAAAFLGWLGLSVVYGRLRATGYPFASHAVSAAKFAEYALLAPAVVLLLRRRADVWVLVTTIVGWSVVMSAVGVLQFLGLLDEFEGRRPGQREPAYLGIHDFAAFSAAALALALVAVAWAIGRKRTVLAGGVAGGIGVILAASIYAVAGVLAATATLGMLVARRVGIGGRRAVALAAICLVVTLGAFSLRGAATDAFLRFLGIRPATAATTENVQSWSQRVMLAYVGGRIFLGHPILGVGFQGSQDRFAFEPYLADAHDRFPDQPPQAFPSESHPWGVQNGPIQVLADMGVVGLALVAAFVLAALLAAGRLALRGPVELAPFALVALAWIVVSVAVISGVGLYAGIPVDALLWLGVGLTVSLKALAPEASR